MSAMEPKPTVTRIYWLVKETGLKLVVELCTGDPIIIPHLPSAGIDAHQIHDGILKVYPCVGDAIVEERGVA